jgi:hypothetical protein
VIHFPGMAWSEIAKSSYLVYLNCAGAHGMYPPAWEALHDAERYAWEAAARHACHIAQYADASHKAGAMNEQKWHGWTPPTV